MLHFKDYLWNKIRINILVTWLVLFLISIISYGAVIANIKKNQLESDLKVAAYTVHMAMNAGEWTIALNYLTKMEANGHVYKILLADSSESRAKLTGPFGKKTFGFGSICNTVPVAEEINLNGCMVVYGVGEILTLAFIIFLALAIYLIAYRSFRSNVVKFITRISDNLQSIGSEEKLNKNHDNEIAEIASIREYVMKLLTDTKEASRAIAYSELSAQVAHDVRSPLTALEVAIKGIHTLPEDKRIMIRNAVKRINDIANNLLSCYSSKFVDNNATCKPAMIMCMLDSIVSEKRTQYRDLRIKFELIVNDDTYTAFADVNHVEFKRMISNLVNNSVDAINHDDGQISIALNKSDEFLQIDIIDNGEGIPSSVINKLFETETTFGKKDGHGLGLKHASKMLKLWNGNIKLSSKENDGTIVSVQIPQIDPPVWFADSINISPNSYIVILDDDPSIHEVWSQRFHQYNAEKHNISIFHFVDVPELRAWLKENNHKNTLYLFDYELVGSDINGIDLINDLSLQNNAILVTSRHEETGLIEKCAESNIKILPKSIAAYVPLIFRQKFRYDAILIDDDPLISEIWSISAKDNNKHIRTFTNPDDFIASVDQIFIDTVIYIDYKLGGLIRGDIIAERIFSLGFKNIFIVTGMEVGFISPKPSYLKGIKNKMPPWEIVENN